MSEDFVHFKNGLHAATVSHLARRLSEAETSLSTLTRGGVDAILDSTGPYLLRAAQERFRQDESWIHALLDSVPDAMITSDKSGKILFQSAAVNRSLGYDPEELVGRNLFEFVHSDDIRGVYHAFFGVIERFTINAAVDFRVLVQDGSWRLFEATIGRLVDPVQGLILILRDPRERRQNQEDEVREKTTRETERLLVRLSRELQTPLRPALLGVHALIEDAPPAEVRPTLDMIRRNLERQSELIDELRFFTHTRGEGMREEIAENNFAE